jgi:hypothetical protein
MEVDPPPSSALGLPALKTQSMHTTSGAPLWGPWLDSERRTLGCLPMRARGLPQPNADGIYTDVYASLLLSSQPSVLPYHGGAPEKDSELPATIRACHIACALVADVVGSIENCL